jgi:hypothetical protein
MAPQSRTSIDKADERSIDPGARGPAFDRGTSFFNLRLGLVRIDWLSVRKEALVSLQTRRCERA